MDESGALDGLEESHNRFGQRRLTLEPSGSFGRVTALECTLAISAWHLALFSFDRSKIRCEEALRGSKGSKIPSLVKNVCLAHWLLNPLGDMLTIQQNRVEENVAPRSNENALELRFPCGLLGFEEIKQYSLNAFQDLHPFLWMEGKNQSGQCFLLVPPAYVVDFYYIELSDEDVTFLGLGKPEDAVVLNVATFHPDGSITVNLKGPIVYNRNTLVSRQVIPKNASTLPLKHPLAN